MIEAQSQDETRESAESGSEAPAAEPETLCPIHELAVKAGESCPACRRELHVNRSWDD
jgi:hypothetical protein